MWGFQAGEMLSCAACPFFAGRFKKKSARLARRQDDYNDVLAALTVLIG